MAVDTTLIRGAYRANQPTGVPGVKEISDTATSVADMANQYMMAEKQKSNKLSDEFESYAQGVLENSDLKGQEFESLYDNLMNNKQSYIDGDKKSRAMQIRDLNVLAQDYDSYRTLREGMAVNIDNMSPRFSNSEDGKKLIQALSGDGKNLKPKDGRLGLEVDGEWMAMQDLGKYLQENTVDQVSKDRLEALNLNAVSNSAYNKSTTEARVRKDLVNADANLKSMAYDEMIPGRNFHIDLIEDLIDKKYSDLGIDDSYFEGIKGVDASNGIDYEEAETIAYSLINDKPLLRETLTKYFSQHINNQVKKNNVESDEDFLQRLEDNTDDTQPSIDDEGDAIDVG